MEEPGQALYGRRRCGRCGTWRRLHMFPLADPKDPRVARSRLCRWCRPRAGRERAAPGSPGRAEPG